MMMMMHIGLIGFIMMGAVRTSSSSRYLSVIK